MEGHTCAGSGVPKKGRKGQASGTAARQAKIAQNQIDELQADYVDWSRHADRLALLDVRGRGRWLTLTGFLRVPPHFTRNAPCGALSVPSNKGRGTARKKPTP
jgi:hypothetical protein